MTETIQIRNVIIGAGAMGTASAYHLAKRGEPVLLLEQFAIGHDRGSSHGAARITRHSYADPFYAKLMPAAFQAWKLLEADAGENLYLRTGGISLCPPSLDYVAQVTASLEAVGVPHRRMSGRELRRVSPVFQVPDDQDVVFEPDAGMLSAARCIAVQVELARRLGGEKTRILEQTPVERIDLEGGRPVVLTEKHRIVADRLIVTAGSWTRRLLPQLATPLQPTRQQVLYFRPTDSSLFRPGRFPVFISMGEGALNDFYGMPEFLGLGVKVARHGGPETNPDINDRFISEEYQNLVRSFLRNNIPALADAPIDFTEVCLYTVAPDDRFCLGSLRGCPEVIIASPCSGHGFKFSCLIGSILADLASQGETRHPIESWQFETT